LIIMVVILFIWTYEKLFNFNLPTSQPLPYMELYLSISRHLIYCLVGSCWRRKCVPVFCVLLGISQVLLTSTAYRSQTHSVIELHYSRKKLSQSLYPCTIRLFCKSKKEFAQNIVKFRGKKSCNFLIFFVTYSLTCFHLLCYSLLDFK
jgi:hypothetical protein